MSDSPRTRIAAVLNEAYPQGRYARYHYAVAGDLIRELGLEPQVHYDPDCEFYRYVTDWIDPQNKPES